jgi:ABC-type Na+ efflux pump permease subunit
MGQPSLGGLLVSFGDSLGGQRLAQPGMLVLHVIPLSSLLAAVLLKAALSSAVAGRW